MFVDMVGYSKLTIEDQLIADTAFRSALATLPTYQAAVQRGRVITIDTGDGAALCFFVEPTLPARAAAELIPMLTRIPKVRVGLHCGPVVRLTDFAGQPNVRGV